MSEPQITALRPVTEVDKFLLSNLYTELAQFLQDPPAGLSEDTRAGLDCAALLLEQDCRIVERASRPSPEDYETARRLRLGHPLMWTGTQADEAARCTGCVVQESHGVRHLQTVPNCPVHATAKAA